MRKSEQYQKWLSHLHQSFAISKPKTSFKGKIRTERQEAHYRAVLSKMSFFSSNAKSELVISI